MKKTPFATAPLAKICTGTLVAAGCRTGKKDEKSVATNTRFGVIRAALVLQGSPNFGVPKDPFHAASGTLLPFAGFGGAVTAPRSRCPTQDSCSGY